MALMTKEQLITRTLELESIAESYVEIYGPEVKKSTNYSEHAALYRRAWYAAGHCRDELEDRFGVYDI